MLRRDDHDAWEGDILSHITKSYLRELSEEILAMGAVISGFKLSELGYYLHTSDDPAAYDRLAKVNLDKTAWLGFEGYQPAFEVEFGGTTGAGDSSYGGFLASVLRGFPPDEAIRMASAVGACNVEQPDSLSGVRTWEDTQARLDAGWKTQSLILPD